MGTAIQCQRKNRFLFIFSGPPKGRLLRAASVVSHNQAGLCDTPNAKPQVPNHKQTTNDNTENAKPFVLRLILFRRLVLVV
jgi:hypothetical protein